MRLSVATIIPCTLSAGSGLDERNIAALPQPEVYKFVKKLEGVFTEDTLSIWDLCCGAGRHTVLIAKMGHKAFGRSRQ